MSLQTTASVGITGNTFVYATLISVYTDFDIGTNPSTGLNSDLNIQYNLTTGMMTWLGSGSTQIRIDIDYQVDNYGFSNNVIGVILKCSATTTPTGDLASDWVYLPAYQRRMFRTFAVNITSSQPNFWVGIYSGQTIALEFVRVILTPLG